MKALNIDLSGLWNQGLLLRVPHQEQNLDTLAGRFKEWTQNEQSPIYSGYRKHTLIKDGLSQSKHHADKLLQSFDNLVIVGIGGSALGAKTAISALQWELRNSTKKTFVLDNLDPLEFERLFQTLELSKTCFAVISKSGGTLETIAQLSVILQRLQARGLDMQKHIVAVTDPEKGALRTWAISHDVPTLDLATAIGGRFSVLSAVGLLPMAFAGVNIDELMDGACAEFERASTPQMIAWAQRLAELEQAQYRGHVVMPYASFLKDFGSWFVQLWGESLGKSNDAGFGAAPIPVAALGDTDQHSLLQLLAEGSQPLITGFVRVDNWPEEVAIRPNVGTMPPDFASLSYATGKTFANILNAQQKATAQTLLEKNRPLYEIGLDQLNAANVGRLFALYMDLVVMTGAANNLNPFDQPGVERGKQILPQLLV